MLGEVLREFQYSNNMESLEHQPRSGYKSLWKRVLFAILYGTFLVFFALRYYALYQRPPSKGNYSILQAIFELLTCVLSVFIIYGGTCELFSWVAPEYPFSIRLRIFSDVRAIAFGALVLGVSNVGFVLDSSSKRLFE